MAIPKSPECLALLLCAFLNAGPAEPQSRPYGEGYDIYTTSSGIALAGDVVYMTWPSKARASARVLAAIENIRLGAFAHPAFGRRELDKIPDVLDPRDLVAEFFRN